jgi:hypothetical protein
LCLMPGFSEQTSQFPLGVWRTQRVDWVPPFLSGNWWTSFPFLSTSMIRPTLLSTITVLPLANLAKAWTSTLFPLLPLPLALSYSQTTFLSRVISLRVVHVSWNKMFPFGSKWTSWWPVWPRFGPAVSYVQIVSPLLSQMANMFFPYDAPTKTSRSALTLT